MTFNAFNCFGGGVLGAGLTQATTFDRTATAYLSASSLLGQGDSATGTIWCSYRASQYDDYLMGNDGSSYIQNLGSSGLTFNISGFGFVGNISGVNPLGDWCSFVISINTNAVCRYIHWGGSIANKITGTLSGFPTSGTRLDFTPSAWGIGKEYNGTGSGSFHGEMAVFGLDINNAVDLTDSAVQARFVKSDGTIVIDRGNGSSYTGAQPLIYLQGGAGSFVNNRGSGGAFTTTGNFSTYTDPVRIDP